MNLDREHKTEGFLGQVKERQDKEEEVNSFPCFIFCLSPGFCCHATFCF